MTTKNPTRPPRRRRRRPKPAAADADAQAVLEPYRAEVVKARGADILTGSGDLLREARSELDEDDYGDFLVLAASAIAKQVADMLEERMSR